MSLTKRCLPADALDALGRVSASARPRGGAGPRYTATDFGLRRGVKGGRKGEPDVAAFFNGFFLKGRRRKVDVVELFIMRIMVKNRWGES